MDDMWRLGDVLKSHKDGVYITQQVMSPVLANGTRLGHPPIHVHHVHMSRIPSVRERSDPFRCAFYNESCYDPTRFGLDSPSRMHF